MSWCDGPPGRKIMMTALWPLRTPALASARRRSGRARPPRPSAPIFKKLRRDNPSQNFDPPPRMLNIAGFDARPKMAKTLAAYGCYAQTRAKANSNLADKPPLAYKSFGDI